MDALLEMFDEFMKELSLLSMDSTLSFLGASGASLLLYGKAVIVILLILLIIYAAFSMLFGS